MLALSLLLAPSLVLANNTADEADVAFELGNEAYAKGNYNEALRSYFTSYRLVPETAADGLLLRAAPGIAAPGPFDPIPEARTLAVEGGADHLTYDFFGMRVGSRKR